MSAKDRIKILQGELEKTLVLIGKIEDYYTQFRKDYPPSGTPRDYDLVILADIVSDYYTCIETAFVRVAKHFENELDPERWHKSLLERMTVDVPGVRKRLVSDQTHRMLEELMRFRHFKRYYVERECDRERMRLLEKNLISSIPLIKKDFTDFLSFLDGLARRL
jgi:hypothetical protein